jgi:hypothetical protein
VCFAAASAVIQKEDDEGIVGVKIGKELMKVAGMALKANITRLGPRVLPVSEQLIFAGNFIARKVRHNPDAASWFAHGRCVCLSPVVCSIVAAQDIAQSGDCSAF